MTVDQTAVQQACRDLLVALGEDPDRPGLLDTPARWARWWAEFIDYQPGNLDTAFDPIHVDQLVVVRNVPVVSLCEHHLLPFTASVTMGYLTADRVVGLSKFARAAQEAAHRLQVQERMVQQTADRLKQLSGTENVAVIARGEHSCMTMRGIRSAGEMVTSALAGSFLDNPQLRAEFLALAAGR